MIDNGDPLAIEDRVAYRVLAAWPHALRLCIADVPGDAEVALADPGRLTWSEAAKGWLGPVVAIEREEEAK